MKLKTLREMSQLQKGKCSVILLVCGIFTKEVEWGSPELGMRDWDMLFKGCKALIRANVFCRPVSVIINHGLKIDL